MGCDTVQEVVDKDANSGEDVVGYEQAESRMKAEEGPSDLALGTCFRR